jgi:hypothetical protein
MAFFKEAPIKTVTKDRDNAKANVDRLATKLAAAEQAVTARRSEAQQLALDGADDAALDKAEAALHGALDRQSTIDAASAEATKLVALLESRLAEMHDRETRAKTAAEVEAIAVDFDSVATSFDTTITELAGVAERAKRYCLDASGLVTFAAVAKTQVADAVAMVAAMLHAHAASLTAAPVVAPEPYVKLFCLKPVRWMADGRQNLARRFTDIDLPPGLAALALRSGACCRLDDPRRKANFGADTVGHPDLKSCFDLSGPDQPERAAPKTAPIQHSAFEEPVIGTPYLAQIAGNRQ